MTVLRMLFIALAIANWGSWGTASLAQDTAPLSLPLRGPTPLDQIAPAPRMTPMRNTTEREVRNYPEQPPVIPHTIEGYQIDLNGNKCLSCHARSRTGARQ
jgi:nitrate reductase (cytochrome), electron transfer subunit